jgi:hypothetical protein
MTTTAELLRQRVAEDEVVELLNRGCPSRLLLEILL